MARSSRHPREVRERAVALVLESQADYGWQWEAIVSVAGTVGVSGESLRRWVRQAEIDAGHRAGTTSGDAEVLRELRRENRELRRANEILKAAATFFARELDSTATLVAFITEHKKRFGVEPICAALTDFGMRIAPSTYYAAIARPPSARALRAEQLKKEIVRVHEEDYSVYGAEKVWWALNREGIRVGRCRVERLMRTLGLAGAVRGKKVRTTVPDPDGARAPDLVKRQFTAGAPNRLWVADFHVRVDVGWHGVYRVHHRCVLPESCRLENKYVQGDRPRLGHDREGASRTRLPRTPGGRQACSPF